MNGQQLTLGEPVDSDEKTRRLALHATGQHCPGCVDGTYPHDDATIS